MRARSRLSDPLNEEFVSGGIVSEQVINQLRQVHQPKEYQSGIPV